MCGAGAVFACLDAMAKYLGTHMDTMQVVGVRYMQRVPAGADRSPIRSRRPGLLQTARPGLQTLAARSLLLVSTVLQLLGVPLSAARRGAGDPVLDAVPGGDPGRADARRMGRLAALDRDRRRLHRRAGGGPAGHGRHAMGGAALVRRAICYAVYGITTRMLARHDSSETTLFYSNLSAWLRHAAGAAVRLDPPPSGSTGS